MNPKQLFQRILPVCLAAWIIVTIFTRPGWLIFGGGCLLWLAVVYITAPGAFWTYSVFLTINSETVRRRLRRAVSHRPALVYPYVTLGLMSAHRKSWDEAIPLLEQAVTLASSPRQTHYRLILSEAYRESGALEMALTVLEDLERQGQASTKLDIDLALTYLKKEDYVKALAYAQKARAADPSLVQAVLIMGRAHFAKADYQAAKDDYAWAIRHLKYPIESYYWLGRSELALADFQAAVEHLSQAAERISEDPLLSDITADEARKWLETAEKNLSACRATENS